MMKKLHIVSLLLTAALMPSCTMPSSGWGSVEGTVYESSSGKPVEGVLVQYSNISMLTDTEGHYAFDDIPEGLQGFTFSKMGFENTVSQVSILRDGVTEQDVEIPVMKSGWAVGASETEFGTIFHTEDAGRNWKRQGDRSVVPDRDLYAVCAVNRKTCWAVGDSTFNILRNRYEFTILKTSDGGNTWRRQGELISDLNPSPLYAICAMDTTTAWAVTDGNAIIKGTSGGSTWTKCFISETTSRYQAISTPDAEHIMAAGEPSGSGLYIDCSDDGGSTWYPVKMEGLGRDDIIYDICAVDSSSIYISGTFGIRHTTDGWATWSDCRPSSGTATGVSALGSYNVWAGTSDGAIFRSCDSFATYTEAATPAELTSPDFNCISFIGDAFEGAATFLSSSETVPGGVLCTDDGGENWREPDSVPYKVKLYEVSFAGSRH